ncbi:MAG: hypothetical protein R3B09_23630 [Nannocystaceae bacterium]
MPRLLALTIAALAIAACDTAGSSGGGTVAPAAETYGRPSAFEGKWLGESDGIPGTLEIQRLGDLRYYARFSDEERSTFYVANLQQAKVPPDEEGIAGNLVKFTWQDGRGGTGSGWLLINREDSALTGMFGYGGSTRAGSMSFVRTPE